MYRRTYFMCKENIKDYVKNGLLRLATGQSNDAVKLVFADELPNQDELERMDLFNVSEIKRVKGGGVEIKLFDRQKAFEKLFEYAISDDDENAAQSLLEALKTAEDNEN